MGILSLARRKCTVGRFRIYIEGFRPLRIGGADAGIRHEKYARRELPFKWRYVLVGGRPIR